MKSIQFCGDDSDAIKTKSLELLLLEKNKSLQTENTQLKVADGELKGKTTHSYQ